MYHGNGEVMKRENSILQPDQALQQLLFMHLEGCGGILISHEFPRFICIRTGASDIDTYEGPAEEIEKLCKAMLLHHAPKHITKRYKRNSFLRLMNKG